MKPNPHIVCATDLSPNSRRAGEVAVAIAGRLDVTCRLVHVTDEFHADRKGTKESRADMRRSRTALRREAKRLRDGGARVDEVLLHGERAERAIEKLVADAPPLLAIVSSVSKSAFDRWTLGSVSEHVAEHSAVPTLVVRAPDRLLAWVRGQRRLKVLAGVDFTVSSDAALAWLRQFQRIAECAITIMHVMGPADGAGVSSPGPRAQRDLQRAIQRKIGQTVQGEVAVRIELNWGRADAALVHAAHEIDADLVVVGTHQHNGLGRVMHPSFSRGVLRHAPCNVLCVPTPLALQHGVGVHPRIDRVLVATDLSSSGDQAIPWAYAAVTPGGVVKLVHVVEPWKLPGPLVPRYERGSTSRSVHRRRVVEAQRRLAALVPQVGVPADITTEVEVVDDGDVAHGIREAARRFDPWLVCLAARPQSTAESLFGSVVRKVIAQNPGPVLLVRPQEE